MCDLSIRKDYMLRFFQLCYSLSLLENLRAFPAEYRNIVASTEANLDPPSERLLLERRFGSRSAVRLLRQFTQCSNKVQ